MQAALSIAPPLIPTLPPSKPLSPRLGCSAASRGCHLSIKAVTTTYDTSVVDYSSMLSVFPAEACETIGGDACRADIYPEVRLQPEARTNSPRTATESVDREYLEYNDTKTDFISFALVPHAYMQGFLR
ncbi:light-regulated protein 1, chloroplastic-like isoform X2 [Hibiscus syriacus]|uniref:light-regulated protein 1, chloroplastic-like isoform X2 n=1 Tax=Hibiscus syriacus TaxID=106335 RepID=UPI001924C38D|nr:light-regulated protein 1, chloroplastic-like isoform X2 [Hibiscus syriacus]